MPYMPPWEARYALYATLGGYTPWYIPLLYTVCRYSQYTQGVHTVLSVRHVRPVYTHRCAECALLAEG